MPSPALTLWSLLYVGHGWSTSLLGDGRDGLPGATETILSQAWRREVRGPGVGTADLS